METRTLYVDAWKDLSAEKPMVFLAGPRQAGKTTLAEMLAGRFTNSLLFNWDIPAHRTRLLEDPRFYTTLERRDDSRPFVVFDEIHKYRGWKDFLKGVYDEHHASYRFLVTGSGRLDLFRKGGDSLAGRYYLMHLWPFTVAELGGARVSFDSFVRDPLALSAHRPVELNSLWRTLATCSGFPEPFLSGRQTTWRRWSTTYSQQLVRGDLRDLTGVKDIQSVESLYHLLPGRVGSPLSIPSLSRDLKVAYNSVNAWLDHFERFFLTFSLRPWTRRIARAIQKERKVYLWDAPRIRDPAARFENLVALELLRAVTCWNDLGLGSFSLHFARDREQREVDFLIADDDQPFLLVETKLADTRPSPALRRFQAALGVPAVQLVEQGDTWRLIEDGQHRVLVAPAPLWLARLP